MTTIDLLLRIAATTELALLCFFLWGSSASNSTYRQVAVLLLAIAGYLLAPLVLFKWQVGLLVYPILTMAIMVPIFFWYFTCTVFSDSYKPASWVHVLAIFTALSGMIAFCSGTPIGQACHLTESPWPDRFAQLLKLAWVAAAFVWILKGWRDDLVEPRRRFRRGLVFIGAAYLTAILLIELIVEGPVSAGLELFNVSLLFLGVTALTLHLLTIDGDNVFVLMTQAPSLQDVNRSELAEQVIHLMEEERVYASEGLTINSLATKLRTQAHHLRPVINGELGHRNFNSFVNLFRVREVAQRLQQQEFIDTPLLTLALEAGFRSLAPFNRSFKEQFGITPSEYRENFKNSK